MGRAIRNLKNYAATDKEPKQHIWKYALFEGMGSEILIKFAGERKPRKGVLSYSGETCSYALLMFFDWRDAGMTDYVAIVKKCEGDIVYTVEGNTSTTVNGNSVRGVWQHQYPIGSGRILGYGMLS